MPLYYSRRYSIYNDLPVRGAGTGKPGKGSPHLRSAVGPGGGAGFPAVHFVVHMVHFTPGCM